MCLISTSIPSEGDLDFGSKVAGSGNRHDALKGTDLLIQSALVPNSRVRGNGEYDVTIHVGPAAGESKTGTIFSTPISAAYVVDDSGVGYQYSTESLQNELTIEMSQTSQELSFDDWANFNLYPGEGGIVEIDSEGIIDSSTNSNSSNVDQTLMFAPVFGGGASSVVQVAAISSAAMGTVSPIIPSTFTQDFSRLRHEVKENNKLTLLRVYENQIAKMYKQGFLDKMAVCSQWPNPCGTRDGAFVDGAIADNAAFAINIGRYHNSGDINQTLKVILTNTNTEWPKDPNNPHFQYTQFLQYFESPLNEGVEPGSFNWPPGMRVRTFFNSQVKCINIIASTPF